VKIEKWNPTALSILHSSLLLRTGSCGFLRRRVSQLFKELTK
jgi:hypothetical protein